MLQIKYLVIFVVFFVMVQSQSYKEVRYLRSWAGGQPFAFPCNSDYGKLASLTGDIFHCDSELCILLTGLCDSIVDCPNFADEVSEFCRDDWNKYCDTITDGKPFRAESCENGMCITECDVCDGRFLDCPDSSDELVRCFGQRPNSERCKGYNPGLKRTL